MIVYHFNSILVPPLFVIEFLHRIVDILEQYFNECNESNIKEHYVVVYEVNFSSETNFILNLISWVKLLELNLKSISF